MINLFYFQKERKIKADYPLIEAVRKERERRIQEKRGVCYQKK